MMNELLVKVPNYVLLDRKQRLGPELLASTSARKCVVIYGFSDKQPYDAFCKKSDLALVPYPLVKGYLRNQLETAEDTTLLIVIDAAGPDDPVVDASTMQAVLEALESKSKQVAVSHRLSKEENSACYDVKEHSSGVSLEPQK